MQEDGSVVASSAFDSKQLQLPLQDVKNISGRQFRQGPLREMSDPFDRVLLLKNIDNPILTSFRTLTKANNVISHTLKIIHNKFSAKQLSRHVKNTYKKARNSLYPVSEVESYGEYLSEGVMAEIEEEQQDMMISNGISARIHGNSTQKSQGHERLDPGTNPLAQDSLISSSGLSPKVLAASGLIVDKFAAGMPTTL